MADAHDAALEWAQANPEDPRAQHIQAKVWAAKNPGDPRSQQILDRLSPSPQNNPGQSVTDRLTDWDRWKAIATNTGPYSRPDLVQGDVPMSMPAAAAPKLAALAGKITSTPMGRIGAGAVQGAVQQAAHSDPETHLSPGDRLHAAEAGAVFGGMFSGAGEGVSAAIKSPGAIASFLGKVTGLSGFTDKTKMLMQLLGTAKTAAPEAEEAVSRVATPAIVEETQAAAKPKFDPFTKKSLPTAATTEPTMPPVEQPAPPVGDTPTEPAIDPYKADMRLGQGMSAGQAAMSPLARGSLQDALNRK